MLPAGKLRHVVAVEEDKGTKDANGQNVADWRVVMPAIRAFVRGQTGREFVQSQQQQARYTHIVTVRFQCKLADTDAHTLRLKWGDKTLNIVNVGDVTGDRRELIILCEENLGTK